MTKQELDAIRAELKARHIKITELAWSVGHSTSWLHTVLAGNYPFMYAADKGMAAFPRDIARALRNSGIQVPEDM